MLRYLRSRIGSSYEVKTEHFDDFVGFKRLATHGFPQKVSAISVDDKLGLISLGTKDGRILIFNGTDGGFQLLSTSLGDKLPVSSLYFVNGFNVLMVLCNDLKTNTQHFIRCKITADHLNMTYFDKERHLKRITCCEMMNCRDDESAFLIGTVIGNVYALWVQKMELTEYIVFHDTALKDLPELESQQNAIDGITIDRDDQSIFYLLFNGIIVVFYNIARDEVLRIYQAKQHVTCMSSVSLTSKLLCSHKDGTYTTIDTSDSDYEECKRPYDGNQCTKITKIISSSSINTDAEFIIYSGGVPSDELGDRYTISIFCGDKSLILDFDSLLIDFCLLKDNDNANILLILCEEELIAIDLRDPLWRMLPLPQLYPIHSSPITSILAVTGVSENAKILLNQLANEQWNSMQIFSKNKWPHKNGIIEPKKKVTIGKELQLVLTGHENGVVNIWMTNELNFQFCAALNTARDFEGYIDQNVTNLVQHDENNENKRTQMDAFIPPIRKAGLFDPYSDDHRLAIQKLFFDSNNAEIAVGGRTGHLLVYKGLPEAKNVPPNKVMLLDMTTSKENGPSSSRLRSESAIQARKESANYAPGFCLINNIIAQFKPAVPVTSLAWDHNSGFLSAGNEFGYVICSIHKKEVLLVKKLLSALDVVQISNLDGPLSRFKSVKKSIRQSFRKKKRQCDANNTTRNLRPAEREIVQRNINPNVFDGGTPASLVKVTKFQTCNLSVGIERYLFVGTHGSVVFIHAVRPSSPNEQHEDGQSQCPLIKEIRLQHQAPIVAVECCCSPERNGGRLIVITEEQIRIFHLPGIKPTKFKFRFTALEGSRIKRACIVQLRSRIRRIRSPESFIALITNRGEIFLFAATSNLKKQYKLQYAEHTDSIAITSATLSDDGQLFYLRPGGSELERCSLSDSMNVTKNSSSQIIISDH